MDVSKFIHTHSNKDPINSLIQPFHNTFFLLRAKMLREQSNSCLLVLFGRRLLLFDQCSRCLADNGVAI